MEKIGMIKMLRRYPVKSMAGEDISEAFVSYAGVVGDRVWSFVDRKKEKANFPWFSARDAGDLVRFVPRFVVPLSAEAPYPTAEQYAVRVCAPEGEEYVITDPRFEALLRARYGKDIYARFSDRGAHDSRPVALFGMPTLRTMEQEMNISLDHRRFRTNIYVEWENRKPFYEDDLVGRKLQIGEKCVVEVSKKDPRCVVITLDPDTAEKNMNILSHVARHYENCAGVYAVVLREGIVRVGDEIFFHH